MKKLVFSVDLIVIFLASCGNYTITRLEQCETQAGVICRKAMTCSWDYRPTDLVMDERECLETVTTTCCVGDCEADAELPGELLEECLFQLTAADCQELVQGWRPVVCGL